MEKTKCSQCVKEGTNLELLKGWYSINEPDTDKTNWFCSMVCAIVFLETKWNAKWNAARWKPTPEEEQRMAE